MSQIKIILSVFGEVFDPLVFNNLTGLDGKYWYKGDPIPNRKIPRKETSWECSINLDNIHHFEKISDMFLLKLYKSTYQIKEYVIQHKLKTKIDIIVEITNKEIPSLFFNRDFIDFSSCINSEIDIDLYILE